MTRTRPAVLLALLLPLILAACSGDDGEPDLTQELAQAPAPQLDASRVESRTVQVGLRSVSEKTGIFGPDLDFVARLPDNWNGRLLLALPPAGGTPTDLDDFGNDQVRQATAYASIASLDNSIDAPAVYLAFLQFLRQQLVAEYGRKPDRVYLLGVSLGGWYAQRMLDADEPLADGALLLSPWDQVGVVQNYGRVLALMDRLTPVFSQLESGALATLSAGQLQAVEGLRSIGLPVGSEAQWPPLLPFWQAAFDAGRDLLDSARTDGPDPTADQARLRGRLTAPTILLQGGWDVVALPVWSQTYAQRVAQTGSNAGLARYVFPRANHLLVAPDEDAAFGRARLQRAWETLLAWVENDLRPGPLLGVEPSSVPPR